MAFRPPPTKHGFMALIWHNGVFKDDGPVLTVHDRLRLGEGLFNTMRVRDGHLYHAPLHFEKLLKNARLFWGNWTPPSPQTLEDAAYALLNRNDFLKGDYAFNTLVTGGESGNGIRSPEPPTPHILMRALPLHIPNTPVDAIITRTVRRNEGSPLSQIKGAHYGDNILALKEAREHGANEAFMLNNRGTLACATTANIIVVQDGALLTPPLTDGCQNGVTRTLLMQKYTVAEKSFTPEDLKNAQGFYLLNSLRGCVPVTRLNNRNLPPPSLMIPKDFHLT